MYLPNAVQNACFCFDISCFVYMIQL
jgi:hypothetical protein